MAEMVGFEVKDDELQQSQDTEALVDTMVFDEGDDGCSDVSDGSYMMSEVGDDDDEVSVDKSCFVKEVQEIDDRQRVTSVVDDHEVDDTIFSEADVEEWRKVDRKAQRWVLSLKGETR